jgi:hypothetical protein
MRFSSILIGFVCAAGLLAGCGGGGGSAGATAGGGGGTTTEPVPFATTAPGSLTLQNGSAETFTVTGGTAPYTAVTNNSAIAAGAVAGNTLTIGGVSPGTATITVFDAKNTPLSVGVTVAVPDLATSAPASGVTIAVGNGNAQAYTIKGGVAPYTVTSSNVNIVTASMPTSTTLAVTGVNSGSASVVVRDAANKTVSIPVTVSPGLALFTTAPSAITLAVGGAPTYTIAGGVAPYTVTSSNTNAVGIAQPTATTFTVGALANGAASVVIRDAVGATTSVAVTVSAAQLAVNPTTVSAFIGDTVYTTLAGGTAPYTIVEGFPDAADVTVGTLSAAGVFTANSSGNVLRIVVKQAVGTDSIIVRDANNNTASFTLSASAGTNAINLSPRTVAISGAAGTVDIREILYGGVGTVNLFSSDTSLITVTSPVSGSAAGTPVNIQFSAGADVCTSPSVTVTAIDSLGQSATSTISIQAPTTCP